MKNWTVLNSVDEQSRYIPIAAESCQNYLFLSALFLFTPNAWPIFLHMMVKTMPSIYLFPSQPAFASSKLTVETLEQVVKYVQS